MRPIKHVNFCGNWPRGVRLKHLKYNVVWHCVPWPQCTNVTDRPFVFLLFPSLLGDITKNDFAYGIDVTIPWSVCHISALCSKDTRYRCFPLQATAPCISQIAQKFGLHQSTYASPDFAAERPPQLIWASETFDGKRLEIVQWSQWRAYRKPPLLLQIIPLLTFYIQPSLVPKWWSQMHFQKPT